MIKDREFFIRCLDFPQKMYFKLLMMSIGKTNEEFLELLLQYLKDLTVAHNSDFEEDLINNESLRDRINNLEHDLEDERESRNEMIDNLDGEIYNLTSMNEGYEALIDFLCSSCDNSLNLKAQFYVIEDLEDDKILEKEGAYSHHSDAEVKVLEIKKKSPLRELVIREFTIQGLIDLMRDDKSMTWQVGRLYKMYESTINQVGTDRDEIVKIRQKVFK